MSLFNESYEFVSSWKFINAIESIIRRENVIFIHWQLKALKKYKFGNSHVCHAMIKTTLQINFWNIS